MRRTRVRGFGAAPTTPKKRRAPPRRLEDEIHQQIVAELRLAGLQDHEFFHAANEGKCSPRMAARRKAFGVNAGVPDLIFVGTPPRALELKSETGKLSDAQKLWIASAIAKGWDVAVEKGLENARARLRAWGYLR